MPASLARKPGREDLLKRIPTLHSSVPADFAYDRDEANERWPDRSECLA